MGIIETVAIIFGVILISPFLFIIATYFITSVGNSGTSYTYNHRRRRKKRYYPRLTPEEKGNIGEYRVSNRLGGTIANKQYLIDDIIIKNGEATTQIDHIFINQNGVYVIETKNYNGYIIGKDFDRNWVQIINKKIKNTFYNPVKQNYTHCRMLDQVTKTKLPIYSIVVFINADISRVMSQHTYTIEQLRTLVNTPTKDVVPVAEMKKLYNTLLEIKKSTNVSKKQHVNNITGKVTTLDCPSCKGKLVKRNGRRGSFLGCTNYPLCTYTQEVPENFKN